jgi:transcriptional regulator with XRE-family HTH domain
MSVVRNPSGSSFSRTNSNDRATHGLVCLSDADRVCEEPANGAVQGTVEYASPGDDAWTALQVDQTLGQLMTEARKHRGLSREEVASQTNIPAYYVRMIESDRYDAIPDQLYLLPFFERYAIFLGLDAQKVVSRFIRDFEKAENEIVEAPAPKTTSAALLARWRRIAQATVIMGILLPCIAWGIGTMRTALDHQADVPPSGATAIDTRPPSAIVHIDARAGTVAQDPAGTGGAVTVSPATMTAAGSESTSGPQITPRLHTQAKPQRAVRRHRRYRRSRHSRQKAGHLT